MNQNQPSANAAERMLPLDRAAQPLGVLVVAEHRQVLEERIELAQLVAPAEQRLLAARVDDPRRRRPRPRAPCSSIAVTRLRAAVVLDRLDAMRLAHVGAERGGVLQQQVIELRAHHVKRVRPPARIVAEEEAPRLARCEPQTNVPPGLRMKPAASIAGMTPSASRIGMRRRQQRLADVVARKALPLEQHDPQPGLREKPRRDTAGRAAADDDDVSVGHGRNRRGSDPQMDTIPRPQAPRG